MSNSVTFSADGTVHSLDGQVLNRATNTPGNVVHDSQKANVGFTINQSDFASFQQNGAPAASRPSTNRVQLQHDDGLVKIGGTETRPEVIETLKKIAPAMFEAPEAKLAEAAKAVDDARAEAADRESLNRHPDDQIEAAHQHFVGEVSNQNQIALLVYAQRGEVPPAELLNKIADEMHVPLHEAIDKVNAISMATQAQFTVLARSMGLDADKASEWLKVNRRDTAMAAVQAHGLRRDLMAWKPLLEQYKAATADGRGY
jgi:hypothetical protein